MPRLGNISGTFDDPLIRAMFHLDDPAGEDGSGRVGNVNYQQLDPAQGSESFRNVLDQIHGRIDNLQAPSYESFLQQGINSPLLQAVLGPALAKLLPGAQDSRQALDDQFRSAGALGSSAQANAGVKNENNIMGQQGSLIGQIISQMLPQMTTGLNQQFQNEMAIPGLLGQLLSQLRPDTVTGSNVPPGAGNQGSVRIGAGQYGMGNVGSNPGGSYGSNTGPANSSPVGVSNPGGGLDYGLQDLLDSLGGGQSQFGGGSGSGGGYSNYGYDPFDDGYGNNNNTDFAQEF